MKENLNSPLGLATSKYSTYSFPFFFFNSKNLLYISISYIQEQFKIATKGMHTEDLIAAR